MNRIRKYKALFNIEGPIDLSDIKKTYRSLMKEWHPDKFQAGDEKATEAEEKSREFIAAYEFLISIAPETKAKNLEAYTAMLSETSIDDFYYKKQRLEVTFTNGETYEYFGVSKKMHDKLNDSLTRMRFARRNIFHDHIYRKSMKSTEDA